MHRRSLLLAAPAFAALPAFGQAADPDAIRDTDMVLGEADAPLTVIEYVSYSCGFCAQFHAGVFPQLKTEWVETGRLRFVVRDLYRNRPDLWAGMLARCGGGERYFGIADLILGQQQRWVSDDPQAVLGGLYAIGRQAGLEDATIQACMQDAEMAERLYNAYVETSEAHEVTGTPTFVLNGQKFGNMSYEAFAQRLTEAAEAPEG